MSVGGLLFRIFFCVSLKSLVLYVACCFYDALDMCGERNCVEGILYSCSTVNFGTFRNLHI